MTAPQTVRVDEAKHSFERLFSLMKEVLKDDVSDVRVSGRLKDSPCCLVTDETGLDPNMAKLFRAMGQEVPASNKILEINASHPVVASLNAFVGQEDKKGLLSEYVRLLYVPALLMEGSKPKDPLGNPPLPQLVGADVVIDNGGSTTDLRRAVKLLVTLFSRISRS